MKVLRLVLFVAGFAIIVLGVYLSFFAGSDASSFNDYAGLNSQTLAMMLIGLIAILTASVLKKRR